MTKQTCDACDNERLFDDYSTLRHTCKQIKECPTCKTLKESNPTPDGDEACPNCGDREMMDKEIILNVGGDVGVLRKMPKKIKPKVIQWKKDLGDRFPYVDAEVPSWKERLFYLGSAYDEKDRVRLDIDQIELENFIKSERKSAIEEERKRIKSELLVIADRGELEILRNEVNNYFKLNV